MFKVAQVAGNGSAQALLKMDSTKEGAIHSIVINNNTGSGHSILFSVGLISFQYDIQGENTEVSNIKINVPVNTMVTVTAPSGVTVTASFIETSIDPAGALSAAQSIAKDIFEQAELMKATLPSGTIFDGEARKDATWSSSKVEEELNAALNNITYYSATDEGIGSFLYFGHTKLSGAVYGGNENPTSNTRLNYDGNFYATTFVEPSDERLKENIETIPNAVSLLDTIDGCYYNLKETGERKVGLIAQRVLDSIPEAVYGSDEDGWGVQHGALVGVLVQAVKELNCRLEKMESKNG